MAGLWEVSVVLAIRDMQWLMRDKSIPMPSLNLSGNAESKLGDCLLTAEDRFFLIEVKPTSKQFKSEWAQELVDKTPQFNKKAFATIIELAKNLGRMKPHAEAAQDVLRSLLGHHFVFWNEEEGTLSIQPYFGTTLAGYLKAVGMDAPMFVDRGAKGANSLFSLSLSDQQPNQSFVTFTDCSSGFFSEIYSKRLGIAIKSKEPSESAWVPLGLLPEDFKDYLQALSPKVEEINAIILSDKGFIHQPKTTQSITEFISVLSSKIEAMKTEHPPIRQGEVPLPKQQPPEGARSMSATHLEYSDYKRLKPSGQKYSGGG